MVSSIRLCNSTATRSLDRPDAPELHFNVGDALFKRGEYDQALREFERVFSAEEQKIQAQAHYNMGNSFFQQQAFEQAVAAYKQALELDAADEDAKVNLELALEKLQEQQQQQQQDSEQDQQDQEQQQDSEPNQQNQEQQEDSEQDQQDQEQQQQQDSEQGQQDQEQQQSEQDQQSEEQPAEQQSISPEEAQQLMDALKNRELDAQKRRFRAIGKAQAMGLVKARLTIPLVLWVLAASSVAAATIQFEASVDRTRASQSEPIRLTLRITSDKQLSQVTPEFDLKDFDVEGPATSYADGDEQLLQH